MAQTEAQTIAHTAERTAAPRLTVQAADEAVPVGGRAFESMTEPLRRVVAASTSEAQDALRRTSQNMAAVLEAGTALSEVGQTLWREWIAYAQQASSQHIEGLQKVAAARTPHEALDAQVSLLKQGTELFLTSATRFTQLSTTAAHAAVSWVPRAEGSQKPRQPA